MDWLTLIIELIGLIILLIWLVIPVQEFAGILRTLRRKPAPPPERGEEAGQ